jgi:hypothetical protein
MDKIQLHGIIHRLPNAARLLIGALLVTMTIGYSVGLYYLYITSDFAAQGIEQNYLGNEEDEEALEMKFKMPEAKLLTVIHTHILSYSFIFSLTGVILLISSVPERLKRILIVEPFVLSLLTFGGLYLLWLGQRWMAAVVMVSGILLTLSFFVTIVILLRNLASKSSES